MLTVESGCFYIIEVCVIGRYTLSRFLIGGLQGMDWFCNSTAAAGQVALRYLGSSKGILVDYLSLVLAAELHVLINLQHSTVTPCTWAGGKHARQPCSTII